MTTRDAAQYAAGVVKALGLREGALPYEVAEAAMGADCLRVMPMRQHSALMRVQSQWQIVLDGRVPKARAAWLFAWQLSSWLLRTDGVEPEEARRLRAPVASELLMHRDVVTRACRSASPESVARAFRWPVAATLLREAELLRVPTTLVASGPRGLYRVTRGDDAGRLPTTLPALELLASKRGIGVTRYQVPEERGVVLRVAA